MYKLGINFDEISNSLDEAILLMKRHDIQYGELRTLNGRNFCFWDSDDVRDVQSRLDVSAITPIAVASPIFKWYVSPEDLDVSHDSFGFNARLLDAEKKQVIDTVLGNARSMGLQTVRIFSGLGKSDGAVDRFLGDPILAYALDRADELDIDLCVENEPVCVLYTKSHLADLFSRDLHPRLKLWLDLANLAQVGDEIDDDFLKLVAPRMKYLHVKDFIKEGNVLKYVPLGKGQLPYADWLAMILPYIDNEVFITIETHAPDELKKEYSEQSIVNMQATLKELVA